MAPAMSLRDTRRRILRAIQRPAPIELPLPEAHGCVMAADATTEYDIPPFSSSETDGFAARSADIYAATAEAPVELRVVGWALSGRPPEATVGWGEAVRIAAGAPIPAGADCVIPVGRFAVDGETVRVLAPMEPGSFIEPAGQDMKAGSVLVPAGRRLSAAELGILATAGYGSALVYPRLRVGVFAIGDLVEPGRPTAFGQSRDANSYALLGAVRDVGAVPYRIGIVRDAESELREALVSNATRGDAFVCAGGPADGADAAPTALAGLGAMDRYEVAVHPGSSLAFGLIDGKPFFSVPSKPVSAFVAFELFVRPALLAMMGRRDLGRPEVRATLDSPISGPPGVTLFVPVRVARQEGTWRCRPTGPAAGSLLGSVVQANGLAVAPAANGSLGAGEQVRVQLFRPLER